MGTLPSSAGSAHKSLCKRGPYRKLMGTPGKTRQPAQHDHTQKEVKPVENANPIEEFIKRELTDAVVYVGIKAEELYKAYDKWAILHNKPRCSNTRFGTEASKILSKIRRNDGAYYMAVQFKSKRINPYTMEAKIYNDLINYYDGDIEEMWKTISNVYEKVHKGIKDKTIKPKYKKLELKKKEWWEE